MTPRAKIARKDTDPRHGAANLSARYFNVPLPIPVEYLIARTATRLPFLAGRLLTLIPPTLERPTLERILNKALESPLAAGAFEFLAGRTVTIHMMDCGWSVTVCGNANGGINVVNGRGAETRITATALDFLRLAAGHIDPDTLFFQRRLRIEGDVALGLEVKNTLDGIDRETLPPILRTALRITQRGLTRSDAAFT